MSVTVLQHAAPCLAEAAEADVLQDSFRQAMRQLAGGVSVITVGEGEDRTGLTATSVSSFSAAPPCLLVCINQASSSWPLLRRYGRFGVNVLGEDHRGVAERFSGRDGAKGAARYEGAVWETIETGAPVLRGALAAIDCVLEEAITRHSHAIIIGRVVAARIGEAGLPLVYWRGGYRDFRP